MKNIFRSLDDYKKSVLILNMLGVLGASFINPILDKEYGIVFTVAIISVFSMSNKVIGMISYLFKNVKLKHTYRIHVASQVITAIGIMLFIVSPVLSLTIITVKSIISGLINNNVVLGLEKYNYDKYGTDDIKEFKHFRKFVVSVTGIGGNALMILSVKLFGTTPIVIGCATAIIVTTILQVRMYNLYISKIEF